MNRRTPRDPSPGLALQEWIFVLLIVGVITVIYLVSSFEDSRSMAMLRVCLNKFVMRL